MGAKKSAPAGKVAEKPKDAKAEADDGAEVEGFEYYEKYEGEAPYKEY